MRGLIVSLLVVPWLAAAAVAAPPAEPPPRVVVSLAPLAGIAGAMLPAGTKVETLIPPGASEHGYDIPPSKLAAMANADLVIYVGLGLEPQVEKYVKDHVRAGRRDLSFAAAVGIAAGDDGHDHADHDHADHDHHGADPHLWLDAGLVRRFAGAVAEEIIALNREGPDTAKNVAARRDEFILRVQAVDAAYRAVAEAAPRKTIIVGHDAYGRLADRYGWKTVAIAGLTASEPTPSAIAAVSAAAREQGVTTVFVEPQLSRGVASRIATACGLGVRVLDPLGVGDWEGMMRSNLAAIATALGAPPPPPPPPPTPAPTEASKPK